MCLLLAPSRQEAGKTLASVAASLWVETSQLEQKLKSNLGVHHFNVLNDNKPPQNHPAASKTTSSSKPGGKECKSAEKSTFTEVRFTLE